MLVKRKQLLAIDAALTELAKYARGVKLCYAIAKNRKRLQDEIEALQKATEPSPEFQEFERQRLELCRKHAEKDAKGEPRNEAGQFVIAAGGREIFDAAVAALREQYTDEIKARVAQGEAYKQLLEESTEVEFHTVTVEQLESVEVPLGELLTNLVDYVVIGAD